MKSVLFANFSIFTFPHDFRHPKHILFASKQGYDSCLFSGLDQYYKTTLLGSGEKRHLYLHSNQLCCKETIQHHIVFAIMAHNVKDILKSSDIKMG